MTFKLILKAIYRFLKKKLKPYEPTFWDIWGVVKPYITWLINAHNFLLSISNSFFLFAGAWYIIYRKFLGWRYYVVWFFWGLYAISHHNPKFLVYLDVNWFGEALNTFFVWFYTATPNRDFLSLDERFCNYFKYKLGFKWPSKFMRHCPNGGWWYPPVYTVLYIIYIILDKLWFKYVTLCGDFDTLLADICWFGRITGWYSFCYDTHYIHSLSLILGA